MIRGHIEVVTNELVQGWMYSSDGKIRNKLLLAFSGHECVGSGRVELYRSDLAQAGLGDGYLGFSFPITVEPRAVGSVTVKIDGSDAVLLQPQAVVLAAGAGARAIDQSALNKQLNMLKWQLRHSRLSQAEYDYLRLLWSLGVYERSLLRREEVGKAPVADASITVATDLLESYLGVEADISVAKAVTTVTFAAELRRIAADSSLAPVVALCSNQRVAVRALESSHITGTVPTEESIRRPPHVDYRISSENLVMMDSRITAELYASDDQSIAIVMASPSVNA